MYSCTVIYLRNTLDHQNTDAEPSTTIKLFLFWGSVPDLHTTCYFGIFFMKGMNTAALWFQSCSKRRHRRLPIFMIRLRMVWFFFSWTLYPRLCRCQQSHSFLLAMILCSCWLGTRNLSPSSACILNSLCWSMILRIHLDGFHVPGVCRPFVETPPGLGILTPDFKGSMHLPGMCQWL